MKKTDILVASAVFLAISFAGYAAGTDDDNPTDSSSTMQMSEDMQGMMGGMHGQGMMHGDMMGHHMMHQGVSPVTIMISPNAMPMMEHGMKQKGPMKDHGKMRHEKMEESRGKMKEHMERMEQRLADIESLLSELVALQKKE